MAKPAISDQATVHRRDACVFFNMGRDKFLRRWDEYYKYHIRHAETTHGIRLLLVDVIEAAFPEAPVFAYPDLRKYGIRFQDSFLVLIKWRGVWLPPNCTPSLEPMA